jgi:anaerobic selenocysteine-containing dehydrogenase
MPFYTTACPRNCYSTCSLRVEIEDGRLRRVEPHRDNHATLEGACLKGLSYVERVRSPDRLLYPLRRKQASGEFERISWDDALDLIVSNLIRIRDDTGPHSVLYYTGSGTKGLLNAVGMEFWKLYGGCTTTFGDLCWPAGLEATRLTLGDNKHSAPWDLANAKLIVMWGKNAAETNIHQMVFVEQALENGAELVVIDPRRTQTSERAKLLIQPRPGTDGALGLAIAHLLIANDHVDRPFIERHVLGFEEFAASVAEFTPAKAARITEVPVEQIHTLAELIGTTSPATISAGFGMQRYTNSGQTMRSILALLAITGNIGKPGAGWVYANLQSHIFDEVKDPIAFFPPEKPDGVIRVSISTSLLGRHMLATKDPPLRMAWVERGNPVTQNPETNTVLAAFRALEFRVVVDQFMTDTAREADLVLPAKTMFEQSDVIGAYWHPYIQLKQKVLDPPGEVRPESEIYYVLARRLGLSKSELSGRIPEPGDSAIEQFLSQKLEPFRDLSLERLRQGPVLAPGHQEIAFSDYVFPTPSGKIELLSNEAARRWHANRLPVYFEPSESTLRDAPTPQEYPLYMMTPNTKNRIHSQFNNLRMIKQLGDAPFLLVNPTDALARSIGDGDTVKVFNDRGSIRIAARLDNGIKTGCVSVTNGWWIAEGGTVNFCSLGRETDMGYGAAFHDNLVQVTRDMDSAGASRISSRPDRI